MLSLTTWNVNGIRAREHDVLAWIAQKRPDILCLQELKAAPEQLPESLRTLGSHWCCWHGHKGYSGVAILVQKDRFPDAPTFAHPEFDHETRIVTATLRIEGAPLEIASIYVPNGGKDFGAKVRFLDALDRHAELARSRDEAFILCGDLNVAKEWRDVHPILRKEDKIGQTPPEREQLGRIIGRGLVDLHRQFEPENDRLFTWWAPWRNQKQKNIGWRLDYVLPSARIAERAKTCVVEREFGSSDHGPLTATFDLEPG